MQNPYENIQPRLESIAEKKLVGCHLAMSLSDNKTGELWRSFMLRRKEISNSCNENLISLQVYNATYFSSFNPQQLFDKWALVEVSDFDSVPKGMETFVLPGGIYAVFDYKGPNTDTRIFESIFRHWLPYSGYKLDNRPHFEVLGKNYKNANPDSEEEIWVPIRLK